MSGIFDLARDRKVNASFARLSIVNHKKIRIHAALKGATVS